MNTCPYCGAPVKPLNSDQLVCEYCGETISTKNSQASEIIENQIVEYDPELSGDLEEKNGKNMLLIVIGYICWGLGVIDFCGMFFGYDLTGVSWSPIVAGVVGELFNYWGKHYK